MDNYYDETTKRTAELCECYKNVKITLYDYVTHSNETDATTAEKKTPYTCAKVAFAILNRIVLYTPLINPRQLFYSK